MKERIIIFRATLLLTMVTLMAHGQDAMITKRDSSKLVTRINGYGNTSLFLVNDQIPFAQIAVVSFREERNQDRELYAKLKSYGIAVRYDMKDAVATELDRQSPQQVYTPTNEGLAVAMDSYRAQSSIGIGTSMVGMLMVFAATAVQHKYNKDYESALFEWQRRGIGTPPTLKSVPNGVPIAGYGLCAVGFAIHLEAGKYFKKR